MLAGRVGHGFTTAHLLPLPGTLMSRLPAKVGSPAQRTVGRGLVHDTRLQGLHTLSPPRLLAGHSAEDTGPQDRGSLGAGITTRQAAGG